MAELNLAQLSAPIEALRDEVEAAYARLHNKWEAIAEKLRSLPIPSSVSYVYWRHPEEYSYASLEFRKWNGSKRICKSYCDPSYEEEITPYEEWSAEDRVNMIQHVPGLFREAEKQVKAFIEKTK